MSDTTDAHTFALDDGAGPTARREPMRVAGSAESPPGSAATSTSTRSSTAIAFAALALAGGTGILLYAAAWLVIPHETERGVDRGRGAARTARAAVAPARPRPARRRRPARLSQADLWPSEGTLWLGATLAGAALVWWQVATRERGGKTQVVADGDAEAPPRRRPRPRPPSGRRARHRPVPPNGRRSSCPCSARCWRPPASSGSSP